MDNTYNSDRLLAEIAGCFEMHSPLEDSVRRILERLSPFVGARSASVWLIENGFVRCIYSLDLEMEGFCLPAVEAMQFGLPVLAADDGALPEVVGSAGRLLSLEDPRGWREAMEEIHAKRKQGDWDPLPVTERAGRFSWAGAAEQTMALYEEVYGERGQGC